MAEGILAVRRVNGVMAMLACLLCATALRASPADAIVGTWLTDDGASKVEVTATKAADGSNLYGGKVVWLKEPVRDGKPLRDANNADASQRERPLIGLPILAGFKAAGGGSRSMPGCCRRPTTGRAEAQDVDQPSSSHASRQVLASHRHRFGVARDRRHGRRAVDVPGAPGHRPRPRSEQRRRQCA